MIGKPSIHLSFDVEENPPFGVNDQHPDDCFFSREGCLILIRLLQECGVKATFFVTGYFAEKNPGLVKQLHDRGHEIANHSYHHRDFQNDTIDDLASEIQQSTKILSTLTGESIQGFRAPFCRYRKDLLPLLKAYNYQYDSSLHPAFLPGKYCNLFSPLSPSQPENGLWEIPLSVIPVIRFPISWWWMRNLGSWVTCTGTSLNLLFKRNAVLYFHPWEFADLPQMKNTPAHITHHTGKNFCRQLKNFIRFYQNKHVDFIPIREKIPL